MYNEFEVFNSPDAVSIGNNIKILKNDCSHYCDRIKTGANSHFVLLTLPNGNRYIVVLTKEELRTISDDIDTFLACTENEENLF